MTDKAFVYLQVRFFKVLCDSATEVILLCCFWSLVVSISEKIHLMWPTCSTLTTPASIFLRRCTSMSISEREHAGLALSPVYTVLFQPHLQSTRRENFC